jgi:hypothetical protein
MRARSFVTGVAVAVALGGAGYEVHRERSAADRLFNQSLAPQIKKDGFSRAEDVAAGGSDSIIGKLTLGACSFFAVDANISEKNGQVVGVDNYSLAVGQIGVGTKFESDTVTVRFQNAQQLESELPGLNCFPESSSIQPTRP